MSQSVGNVASKILFVNEQIAFHRSRADEYKNNKRRHIKHLETTQQFESLLELLLNLEKTSKEKKSNFQYSLFPNDLEGLPKELLNELSISDADKEEFVILEIIEKNGGTMSLDQILIQYYKSSGKIIKRAPMTNRLYRMGQKGIIFSLPGKKGIYSTEKPEEQKIEVILGQEWIDPDGDIWEVQNILEVEPRLAYMGRTGDNKNRNSSIHVMVRDLVDWDLVTV